MSSTRPHSAGTFADKLRLLRETIKRPDKDGKPGSREYSLEDIARGVREHTGATCSKQYVKNLLDGIATNPSLVVIEGLARHFDVPTNYFFDEVASAQMQDDLRLAAMLRETGVRALALRAVNLAPDDRASVLRLIEEIQQREAARGSDIPSCGQSGDINGE